ncbi:acyl carrier protein [Flavobacterium gelidilacus]|uniref:acyl carrier protein n=1 Tax=Flavobacterium gelidilacus TaxID=206041 RepID=UPI000405B11B|nr:acyl carrier protein [Flavobacterium gelidilacus]
MNKQEIIERLKPIVKPFVKDEEAFNGINEKTHFITDLNINSANLVDIVLDVEEAFDIEIDNESMEKMLDLENTIAIIQTKLAEK